MTEQQLFYLASPYTSAPAEDYAYQVSLDATRALLRMGFHVYSPIVYGHMIDKGMLWRSQEERHASWMAFDRHFMDAASALLVLKAPGWQQSRGIAMEREYFAKQGKTEILVDPAAIGVEL